jgi:4'-phosphopantetheinyl transferase
MLDADILWSAPPASWSLRDREIHVWAAALEFSSQVLSKLELTLSFEERERGRRFHFVADRNAFIGSRGMLRAILASYLKLEPKEIHFEFGRHGKPILANQPDPERLQFNLAHSDGLFLTAVSRFCAVGVDVERIRDLADTSELANQLLSPTEEIAWRRLPLEQQKMAFFNLWTRKEACLKATGDGITERLKEITVSFASAGPTGELEPPGIPESTESWTLRQLHPAPEFAAVLAAPVRNFELSCWRWPL